MISGAVIVTGASGGIGRAIARRLAAEGRWVVINYHSNEQAALDLLKEIEKSAPAMSFRADVTDPEQVREMVRAAISRFGGVYALVNNAGVAWRGLIQDMTLEDWRGIFAVNADGVFNCIKAVLPGMISAKSGRIINISSIWGDKGASCEAAYSASKAAVLGLTKALAKELGPSGIAVNAVSPGVIDCGMSGFLSGSDKSDIEGEIPLRRLGVGTDAAEAVSFLLSDRAGYITGQNITVDGGFSL